MPTSLLSSRPRIDIWVPAQPAAVAEVLRSEPRWTQRFTPGQYIGTVEGDRFRLFARSRSANLGLTARAEGTFRAESGGTRITGEAFLPDDAREQGRRLGLRLMLPAALFFAFVAWGAASPWTLLLIGAFALAMPFFNSSSAVAHHAELRDALPAGLEDSLRGAGLFEETLTKRAETLPEARRSPSMRKAVGQG